MRGHEHYMPTGIEGGGIPTACSKDKRIVIGWIRSCPRKTTGNPRQIKKVVNHLGDICVGTNSMCPPGFTLRFVRVFSGFSWLTKIKPVYFFRIRGVRPLFRLTKYDMECRKLHAQRHYQQMSSLKIEQLVGKLICRSLGQL